MSTHCELLWKHTIGGESRQTSWADPLIISGTHTFGLDFFVLQVYGSSKRTTKVKEVTDESVPGVRYALYFRGCPGGNLKLNVQLLCNDFAVVSRWTNQCFIILPRRLLPIHRPRRSARFGWSSGDPNEEGHLEFYTTGGASLDPVTTRQWGRCCAENIGFLKRFF